MNAAIGRDKGSHLSMLVDSAKAVALAAVARPAVPAVDPALGQLMAVIVQQRQDDAAARRDDREREAAERREERERAREEREAARKREEKRDELFLALLRNRASDKHD